MNKTVLALLALPLFSTAAHAQANWPLVADNGGRIATLDRCYRQGADVICEGSYAQPYDTRTALSSSRVGFTLVDQEGRGWEADQVLLRGQDARSQAFPFYAKVPYPMKLVFKNYPSNSALRLDMNNRTFNQVQFSGASNLPAGVSAAMKTSTPIRLGNQNFLMTLSDCQTVQGTVIGCKTLLTPQ